MSRRPLSHRPRRQCSQDAMWASRARLLPRALGSRAATSSLPARSPSAGPSLPRSSSRPLEDELQHALVAGIGHSGAPTAKGHERRTAKLPQSRAGLVDLAELADAPQACRVEPKHAAPDFVAHQQIGPIGRKAKSPSGLVGLILRGPGSHDAKPVALARNATTGRRRPARAIHRPTAPRRWVR